MLDRISVEDIMRWGPCKGWPRERVEQIAQGRSLTPLEILELELPADDRLWVVLRPEVLDERKLRLYAADCVERVIPIWERAHPEDDRPQQVIEAARRYARGEATRDELRPASTAAWVARADRGAIANRVAMAAIAAGDAWSAAWVAVGVAVGVAAEVDGIDADWSAVWAAEREWQIARLRQYLEGTEETDHA